MGAIFPPAFESVFSIAKCEIAKVQVGNLTGNFPNYETSSGAFAADTRSTNNARCRAVDSAGVRGGILDRELSQRAFFSSSSSSSCLLVRRAAPRKASPYSRFGMRFRPSIGMGGRNTKNSIVVCK